MKSRNQVKQLETAGWFQHRHFSTSCSARSLSGVQLTCLLPKRRVHVFPARPCITDTRRSKTWSFHFSVSSYPSCWRKYWSSHPDTADLSMYDPSRGSMQVHTSVYEVSKTSIPLYPIRKVQLLPETNKKKGTWKSIKNKTDTKQCFSRLLDEIHDWPIIL